MRRAARLAHQEIVSLREAEAKLSGLIERARDGMRVVITNHGTPIADLVSHGASAMAMRTLKRPGALPKLVKPQGGGPTASEIVLMDRAG